MSLNEKTKFTDKEIMKKGSKALIKELGYSGFLRFIRHSEEMSKENYLNLEDELFKDMSVDDIFDNSKEYWEKESK